MKRRIKQAMRLVRHIFTPELTLNDVYRTGAPRHSVPSANHLRDYVKVWLWILISILVSLALGRLN